jgi:hypothetical protein
MAHRRRQPGLAARLQIPQPHAWVVETLLEAGASIIGKTITDKVSLGILGENAHDGTAESEGAGPRTRRIVERIGLSCCGCRMQCRAQHR